MKDNAQKMTLWIVAFLAAWVIHEGLAATTTNTPPVVTNVSAGQLDYGMVEITYDVTDEEGNLLSVMIEISNDGGATWLVPVGTENLKGDVGNGVVPGKDKRIIWDAPEDQPNVNSASYRVRITAAEQPEGMVLIPAGTFVMGDDDGRTDEQPAHTVYLDAFFIDQYEITNKQFAEFLNKIGRHEDADGNQLIDLTDAHVRIEWHGLKDFVVKKGH
jgi:formylglycine-generating enzyme required for sulfatase activity